MTILERILTTKRNEVDLARRIRPQIRLEIEAVAQPPPRDFFGAVTESRPNGPNLIAEIKKKSPSAGLIVRDFEPAAIALQYAHGGAAAISVLTDQNFFGGDLSDLVAAKRAVDLPILRKDFVVDEYQVFEARAAGADAVLLIAEALTAGGIAALLPTVQALGMTALVEVHSADVLASVLALLGLPGRDRFLLGINNRDLSAQATDRGTMRHLGAMLPKGTPFVAESGLASRDHVIEAQLAGACAVLIGESILKSGDISAKIAELFGRQ